jgi:hypothetical protein
MSVTVTISIRRDRVITLWEDWELSDLASSIRNRARLPICRVNNQNMEWPYRLHLLISARRVILLSRDMISSLVRCELLNVDAVWRCYKITAQKESHAMEMEDLAVCCLQRKSTHFPKRVAPVCSLFAVRCSQYGCSMKDFRLRAQGVMWTTQLSISYAWKLQMTLYSSELRKERAGSL